MALAMAEFQAREIEIDEGFFLSPQRGCYMMKIHFLVRREYPRPLGDPEPRF